MVPDVEGQNRTREPEGASPPDPTPELQERGGGRQLHVQGALSATFRPPNPLSSLSLTVEYKSEKPVYPDLKKLASSLAKLPSVPTQQPGSDSDTSSGSDTSSQLHLVPSAPPMEARPSSTDSGIQSDVQDAPSTASNPVAGPSGSNPVLPPSSATASETPTTTAATPTTSQTASSRPSSGPSARPSSPTPSSGSETTSFKSVIEDSESDMDLSDHEEGEVSDSESAAEDDDNDDPRSHRHVGPLLGAAGLLGLPVPVLPGGPVVAGPLTAVAQQQVAVAQQQVTPPAQVAQQHGGRGRGRAQRARGRPRRRPARKRPWDLSDGSLSPPDEEAGFPSRISPRNKKPFQGYRNF